VKKTFYILTFLLLTDCAQSKSEQTTTTVSDTTAEENNSFNPDTAELTGQATKLTEPEIEKFTKTIDMLKTENKLEKISYPDMSACGGGLDGYFLDKKLVLIEATYQAELGYSSKTLYVDHDVFVKIIYREHFAEWGKYESEYPSDKYEFNANKMTYSDILYTITFATPMVFEKQTGNKIIRNEINQTLIDDLVNCGQEMKKELNEVTRSYLKKGI
jgi:hypothetical protein